MRRITYSILLLLACAGALVLATNTWSLRRRNAAWRENYGKLSRQVTGLRIQINSLSTANRNHLEQLREQSARLATAEEKLQEEKATNDPLRAQLTRLVAKEIRARKDIETHKAAVDKLRTESTLQVAELTQKLATQEKELNTARSQVAAAQQTTQALTAQAAKAGEALKAEKKALEAVHTQVTALSKQLKAQQAENQKLKAQLDALRKPAAKPTGN
jgi:chromosome segregation ATPase